MARLAVLGAGNIGESLLRGLPSSPDAPEVVAATERSQQLAEGER